MVNILDKLTPEQLENFETHIRKDEETGCLVWVTASKSGNPTFHGKDARRIAHALFVGEDIGPRHGLVCRHNQYCVNPEHFEKPEKPRFMETIKKTVKKTSKFKPIPALTEKDRDRFFRFLRKDPLSDCILWQGCVPGGRFDGDVLLNNVFGIFSIHRKPFRAHRVAYLFATGIDPGKCSVVQTCGNKNCCNPDHLILVEPGESKKMASKSKKLSDADREKIKKVKGVAKKIAKRFGITALQVYQIRNE